MIRCGFEQGAALMGCTSVQNIFILEYMPKAPELYCKVYLFGLMQCGCRRLENADLCASLGIDSAKALPRRNRRCWQQLILAGHGPAAHSGAGAVKR